MVDNQADLDLDNLGDHKQYSPFSYKNIQEKLSMINVGGGCGEFVIINMNEIRRKINEI